MVSAMRAGVAGFTQSSHAQIYPYLRVARYPHNLGSLCNFEFGGAGGSWVAGATLIETCQTVLHFVTRDAMAVAVWAGFGRAKATVRDPTGRVFHIQR